MLFGILTNCLLILRALCLGHLPLTAETQRSKGDVAMLLEEGFHAFSALALQAGTCWFPALVTNILLSFHVRAEYVACSRLGLICLDRWAGCHHSPVIFHFDPIIDLYL